MIKVVSTETPDVVILKAAIGFKVVTVPFFEMEKKTGVIVGFIAQLGDPRAS